jgi:ribonucleoside-diphosphate reductase alpha chain
MYFYAWQKGLKTTYYLRSRPATRIAKATVNGAGMGTTMPAAPAPVEAKATEAEAVACSLENPESCEACQ